MPIAALCRNTEASAEPRNALAFFSERILLDNDEEQMTQPGYYHGQSGGSNSAYYPSPYRMLAEEQTTLERTG